MPFRIGTHKTAKGQRGCLCGPRCVVPFPLSRRPHFCTATLFQFPPQKASAHISRIARARGAAAGSDQLAGSSHSRPEEKRGARAATLVNCVRSSAAVIRPRPIRSTSCYGARPTSIHSFVISSGSKCVYHRAPPAAISAPHHTAGAQHPSGRPGRRRASRYTHTPETLQAAASSQPSRTSSRPPLAPIRRRAWAVWRPPPRAYVAGSGRRGATGTATPRCARARAEKDMGTRASKRGRTATAAKPARPLPPPLPSHAEHQ